MKVIKQDSLEFLKSQADFENDIIFADPPYALGSEIIIRKDGKVDYAKASDFMNKWEMPTGVFWEKWFIEAYRTLKHGGYLLMYGMDRQLLLFKYYASLAGFQEQQSIYWYYISNFPKATDLSKMIDKNAGAEREVIGKKKTPNGQDYPSVEFDDNNVASNFSRSSGNIEAPSTELAKKYDGYKYSVAPLKQTCETIMVFKKPNKTGSVLHDTLAMENGDDTITCSALDIEGNRVGTDKINIHDAPVGTFAGGEPNRGSDTESYREVEGRYPAQTFIDSQVAERLDLQSGVSGGGNYKEPNARARNNGIGLGESDTRYGSSKAPDNYGDIGGCSKILHKCDYEKIDFDLFIYEPKVDSGERNNGLDDIEDKVFNRMREDKGEPTGLNKEGRFAPTIAKNNHPTLKPIELNAKILKLFKTPNEQRICYPFAGSGSEIIGGLKANFQNWSACEINADYVEIANARIKHYKENEYVQIDLFEGL
jgi:site-specific DNA-methyltransferase (adenine-specific)